MINLKSTGVVRRIDDLGRIVIPKEIRRNLRIREGDSLEIYSQGSEGITLKKYSQVENIEGFINQYVDAVFSTNKFEIIVTDTEKVIAAAGSFRKDIIGKRIDIRLDERMHRLTTQIFDKDNHLEITDNLIVKTNAILRPIAIYGDVVGSVIIVNDKITEIEKSLVETSASFISKYLEA